MIANVSPSLLVTRAVRGPRGASGDGVSVAVGLTILPWGLFQLMPVEHVTDWSSVRRAQIRAPAGVRWVKNLTVVAQVISEAQVQSPGPGTAICYRAIKIGENFKKEIFGPFEFYYRN